MSKTACIYYLLCLTLYKKIVCLIYRNSLTCVFFQQVAFDHLNLISQCALEIAVMLISDLEAQVLIYLYILLSILYTL